MAGRQAPRRPRLLALASVGVFALTLAAAAWGDNYTFRFIAKDQAAAKAGVLRSSDLGSGGWKGGLTKPDLSGQPACGAYHPKHTDLVVTGAAQSEFFNGRVDIVSEAELLRSAAMVREDWQRTTTPTGFLTCFRTQLAQELGAKYTIASFSRLAFPRVAPDTLAVRGRLTATGTGTPAHLVFDAILIGKGRTEISLGVIAAAANVASSLAVTEQRLARILAARAG